MTAALLAALAAVDVLSGVPVEDLAAVHPLVVVGAGQSALALVSRLPAKKLSGVLGACLATARRLPRSGSSAAGRARSHVPSPPSS